MNQAIQDGGMTDPEDPANWSDDPRDWDYYCEDCERYLAGIDEADEHREDGHDITEEYAP